jgi:hypothetical protein
MIMKNTKDQNSNLPATPPASSPPSIPDSNLNAVIELSDDAAIWCKLADSGFTVIAQGKLIPEIVGRLVSVQPYLINFDAGDRLPAKKPHVKSDTEIPEGYSRRCDIKVEAGGSILGISLAPSSMKFQLSPYLKFLKNSGLRPEQVVTRLTSKRVSNNQGTFNVCVFELVDGTKKVRPSETPSSDETSPELPEGWE